ncbi:M20 family peptidase [Haloimpatiens sp. FM7315]|uniref:M20 family peptidase n=1 Tax=Haloimpatiens sp. FM7315 TaxID=3298609 RepID=UPI00370B7501
MKQEIISYLSTLESELKDLSKNLYDIKEESFKEYKSSKYICSLLKKHGFEVEENFLEIPTSFKGEFGNGHPKICYICEYDADPLKGHITGNNLTSTMAVGACLGLSKVISKSGGTVIILGCPGEYINGCKTTMAKQGVFKDIDVVLSAHPNTITTVALKSNALLPLKIKYSLKKDQEVPLLSCTATHCAALTYNFIDILKLNLPEGFSVENILMKGKCNPYLISSYFESNYLISANTIKNCEYIKNMILNFAKNLKDLMDLDLESNMYQLPYEEMISNDTLCRIFSHNLKETGIIDFHDFHDALPGLSLGSVSHVVPCINHFIKITENQDVAYPSSGFAKETLKDYAFNQSLKAIKALAITGLDLIENSNLLKEIKLEFSNKTK